MNPAAAGPVEVDAYVHDALRFAVAVTGTFVACEVLQWTPTFLGAVFAVVVLGNLPKRPPLKVALVLVLVMALSSSSVYVLASALRGMPLVLFGLVSLCMFLAFYAMASGKPALPFVFLVISLTTIPVVELAMPTAGGKLAEFLPRGLAVGLVAVIFAWVAWPQTRPRAPAPVAEPSVVPPVTRALISVAVVVPVMLLYLLYGWADIMPVLIATVLVVLTFDPAASRKEAWGRVIANFAGGLLGFLVHALLLTTPSIVFLSILLFVMLLGFGRYIYAGGFVGHVAVVACNAMLIILSSAIASGPGSLSLWLVRLFQFSLAGAFAVGMMELLWHRVVRRPAWRAAS